MKKRITVIGGAATGHYMAGLMAMKGAEVTLCDTEAYKKNLDAVTAKGGIILRGMMHGFGTPANVTCDFGQAVKGAELIFIDVWSDRHEEIARLIAPYVEDGQHIIILPGNLGSFVFRKVFNELGIKAHVTLTEWEGNLGPCRLTRDAEVTCGLPFRPQQFVSSNPASDTQSVIEACRPYFDLQPRRNVLDCMLNSGNVVVHIAGCVMSTTAIDRMGSEFSLFKHGFTKSNLKIMTAVRDERAQITAALDVPKGRDMVDSAPEFMPETWKQHPFMWTFREYMDGPDTMDHRYIHEDCGCGGALVLSIAKRLGYACPVLESLLLLAGTINGRDYINDGRTLENCGFDESLSMEQIFAQL